MTILKVDITILVLHFNWKIITYITIITVKKYDTEQKSPRAALKGIVLRGLTMFPISKTKLILWRKYLPTLWSPKTVSPVAPRHLGYSNELRCKVGVFAPFAVLSRSRDKRHERLQGHGRKLKQVYNYCLAAENVRWLYFPGQALSEVTVPLVK